MRWAVLASIKVLLDNFNIQYFRLLLFIRSCANQDKLTAAIKDFRDALAICPTHKNANKYLTATLVEYGIQWVRCYDFISVLKKWKLKE